VQVMSGSTDKKGVYLQRIQECFPDLALSHIETNGEGLVNDVLIVDGERVFRFPKDADAAQALRQEVKILELVRESVDMTVPVFDYVEDDFVSYRLIPGTALLRDDVLRQPEGVQERLAGQLGTFLQQLHAVPEGEWKKREILPSVTVRQRADWLRTFEEVQRELFPLLMAHAREWVRRHFEPVLADASWMEYEPSLINGDLGVYHLLYDPDAQAINGVIDFGTAGIGDPANDLALLLFNYGETFVRRIAGYYPGVGELIERARFWAGTLELGWALGGVRTGDLSWFAVHIGSARDVMPIGTGW
jgi:aminoglycoside 2''-phosphotransferase